MSDYPTIVKAILIEYADYFNDAKGTTRTYSIFDDQSQRYLIVSMGWDGNTRHYHVDMHMDIIDGKVWIQANDTEYNIADDLMIKGVPNTLIVLGLQPEDLRKYTPFAVK